MAGGEPGRRIKGRLMMAARKTIKLDTRSLDADELTNGLSPEARDVLTTRYLATDWYPIDSVDEVMTKVSGCLGMAPEEYAVHVGIGTATEAAGRMGRTLLSLFGSPKRLARYVAQLPRAALPGHELTFADFACRLPQGLKIDRYRMNAKMPICKVPRTFTAFLANTNSGSDVAASP